MCVLWCFPVFVLPSLIGQANPCRWFCFNQVTVHEALTSPHLDASKIFIGITVYFMLRLLTILSLQYAIYTFMTWVYQLPSTAMLYWNLSVQSLLTNLFSEKLNSDMFMYCKRTSRSLLIDLQQLCIELITFCGNVWHDIHILSIYIQVTGFEKWSRGR